jgi:hypothetical protein
MQVILPLVIAVMTSNKSEIFYLWSSAGLFATTIIMSCVSVFGRSIFRAFFAITIIWLVVMICQSWVFVYSVGGSEDVLIGYIIFPIIGGLIYVFINTVIHCIIQFYQGHKGNSD